MSVWVRMRSQTRWAHTLVCTSLPCFATTILPIRSGCPAQKARRMPGHSTLLKDPAYTTAPVVSKCLMGGIASPEMRSAP